MLYNPNLQFVLALVIIGIAYLIYIKGSTIVKVAQNVAGYTQNSPTALSDGGLIKILTNWVLKYRILFYIAGVALVYALLMYDYLLFVPMLAIIVTGLMMNLVFGTVVGSWEFVMVAILIFAFTQWEPTQALIKDRETWYKECVVGGECKDNTSAHSEPTHTSLCGPNKFVDGTATSTRPLRLTMQTSCQLTLQKTDSIAAVIRYNNDGNWLPWEAYGAAPKSTLLIKTFEVRPLKASDTLHVVANFPRYW